MIWGDKIPEQVINSVKKAARGRILEFCWMNRGGKGLLVSKISCGWECTFLRSGDSFTCGNYSKAKGR